ncbi:MAG: Fur family transcriptional regulator [Desulfotomaculaceae bacterium]|nr:Fur family transcriptional regulator [Desulfotomaculaceae bacterium]
MTQPEIIKKFKEKGYKITPQRRAIIDVLVKSGKPPTAKEVLRKVRVISPEVSLDTVYRNLKLLSEMGYLIQINLRSSERSRFEILKNGEQCHHHLVCIGCGDSVCLRQCVLSEQDLKAIKEKGYEMVGHAYEIYGYCPKCHKKK